VTKAKKLPQTVQAKAPVVTFGVFATGDPRIDEPSRQRATGRALFADFL